VLDKNKHIGSLFAKLQEQEQEFQSTLQTVKTAQARALQEELARVVAAKNIEIGDLFNANAALRRELDEVGRMRESDTAALKQQVLRLQDDKDEMQLQNDIMQDEIIEKS
jgi:hypothetical protein